MRTLRCGDRHPRLKHRRRDRRRLRPANHLATTRTAAASRSVRGTSRSDTLLVAAGPRAVRHRHLGHRVARVAAPGSASRCSRRTRGLRQQVRQHFAPEHLQAQSHVAHAGAEQRPGEPVVAPREEPPPPRVLAVGPVAGDDRVLVRQRGESAEVGQVELAVGVGERDQLEPRRLEAGAQRRPVAAVRAVPEQPRVRGVGSSARRLRRRCRPCCRRRRRASRTARTAARARPRPRATARAITAASLNAGITRLRPVRAASMRRLASHAGDPRSGRRGTAEPTAPAS